MLESAQSLIAGGVEPIELPELEEGRLPALVHELANLVQAVSGNLELLAMRTADETSLALIGNAREAATLLTDLTRNFQVEVPSGLSELD